MGKLGLKNRHWVLKNRPKCQNIFQFQLENDLKAAHQKLSLTEEELDKAESSVTELTTRAEAAEKEAEEAQRYLLYPGIFLLRTLLILRLSIIF